MKHSVLLILLSTLLTPSASGNDQPNILFIYLDDFGWRDAGFMGSDFYETPHLDRLARNGMVFTNAYSCAANCAPARACLLSGQYTPRHQIYNVGTKPRGDARYRRLLHVEGTSVLRDEIVTWAEVLREAGYRTGQFGKWHLGRDPKTQGFDVAVDHRRLGFKGHRGPNGQYLADVLTDRTIEFIRDSKAQPWCAYLAHFAVHTPLQPKPELLEKYRNKPPGELHDHVIMATMIQAVDDGIGRIVSTLQELDLLSNTVIVFSSDNGGYGPATDMDPLWGYKGTYFEGGIREPFFVHWPAVIDAGRRSDDPVIAVDLFPTFVDIAMGQMPDQPSDGVSLVPLLKGTVDSLETRALFWHFPAYLQSYEVFDEQRDPLFRSRPCSIVRQGDWKLHEYHEQGTLLLFNLKEDVSERNDLAKSRPDKVDELYGILVDWRERTGAPIPRVKNPRFDPAIEARDRSTLGTESSNRKRRGRR